MVLVDHDRRPVEVNIAARLAFRLCLDELRRLRIDDLTPPARHRAMRDSWQRLVTVGWWTGAHQVAVPDGTLLDITCYGVANALPEQHLLAFTPADWPESEFPGALECDESSLGDALTPRELEVLDLAAAGCNGPMIAARLVLSAATVRTHFEHIYEKLEVRDRAAAVAKAMRMGLIA